MYVFIVTYDEFQQIFKRNLREMRRYSKINSGIKKIFDNEVTKVCYITKNFI